MFGFHVHVANVFSDGAVRAVIERIFGPGAGGVSFFFVLSGYVLTWSARPHDTAIRFWRRRFARIYPSYLVALLAAIAAVAIAGVGVDAAVALPNLLLVQAWIPDPRVFFGPNPVSWFVACEAFFYALFPLLQRGLVRLPGNALWPVTTSVFATVWAIPLAAQALPQSHRYWAIWILPMARLPEFLAGMLLSRIVREQRWPALGVWPVTILATIAYFSSVWLPEGFRLVAGTAIPMALLVAAAGAADAADRPTPWRSRWLVQLGELSFTFFLVHQLAIRIVVELAGPTQSELAAVGVVATSFLLTLLGSSVLYRLVEIPGLRLLRPRRAAIAPSLQPAAVG